MSEEHKEENEHAVHPKKSKDSDYITVSRTGIWQGVSAILGLLLVISLFTGGFGIGSDNAAPVAPINNEGEAKAPSAAAPSPTPTPRPAFDMVKLMGDDSVKGDADAPVTIVEFSDYECPYCGRFYKGTYGQIVEEYIDTGKVKLVFRDFPLSFHQNAQKAAEAAECAGEQDKY